MSALPFERDDGGRAAAGFHGRTGDCVVRAIAIAAGLPYREVYRELNQRAKRERPRKSKRSSARTGVHRRTYEPYLLALGFRWIPTMLIGSGTKVHLRAGEIPATGRLVVAVSRHLVAVVDGVVRDSDDPGRDGNRCVYGYYTRSLVGDP